MTTTIDDKAKVGLGLIITIISVAVTLMVSAGAGVWYAGRWTSKMEEKMDNMTSLLQTSIAATKAHDVTLEDLKARLNKIETVGSPQVMMIQKDVTELRRLMELHAASDKKSP